MDQIDERVAEKLATFEREQDPVLLHEVLDLIEATEREAPPGDMEARRQLVSRRLRLLAELDRYVDPEWDVDRVPVAGAPPPPTHGVVYPSGEVDPAGIPNPTERAEYERALKTSKEYAKWYDVQYQLREIERRAQQFLELFIAGRYADSAADRREIEDLLAEYSGDEERKQALRSAVGRRGN